MNKRILIGAQLGCIMGFALLLMVTLLGVTIYEFRETSTVYQTILSGSVARTIALQGAQDDFHEGLSELRGYIAYNDSQYAADTLKLLNESHEAVKTFTATVTSAESNQVGEKLEAAMASYKEEIKQVIALKQANDAAYSKVLAGTRDKTEIVNKLFADAMKAQDSSLQQRIGTINDKQAVLFTLVSVSSAVGILIVIAILIWYSRQLARRIGNLRRDLLAMGQLDLSRSDVHVTRNDEIGDMAQALIKMKHALKDVVGLVKNNADTLSASSAAVSASVEEQLQVSESIAKTIADVSAGAEKNTNHINEISAVIQEVGASAEEMTASAAHVNYVTKEAVSDASQGMQLIQKLVTQNDTIEKSMKDITMVSESLVKGSSDIQKIVTAIGSIAGQTNLLALNAAIEAARAGEAGRGFSVVAEEVRKLAEQSAESTQHIGEIIERMTKDIQFAVDVVTKANAEVITGRIAANETQQGFAAIISKLDQVKNGIEQISQAVEETAHGMQSVVNNVQNISAVAEETSTSAESVAASAEEQNASLNEVNARSESLSKMAAELNKITTKFKI